MSKRLLLAVILVVGIIRVAFSEDFSFNLLHTLNGRYVPSKYPYVDEEVTFFYPTDMLQVSNYTVDIKIFNDEFQIIEDNHITSPALSDGTVVNFQLGWKLPNSTRFIIAYKQYYSPQAGNIVYSSALISFTGQTLFSWNEYIVDAYLCTHNDKCFLLAYCLLPTGRYRTYVYSVENSSASNRPDITKDSSVKKKSFDLNGIPVVNTNTPKVVISVMEDGKVVKHINSR